ncbi:hypothetical protein B0O80DRAFT_453128 [Mortierella sp. GBAus27b]|nr:hypothetical protein BGX31_008082 [Mortierella sp. GBA43]KAI8353128.1 hypothetical protein B0O80DRAFT_453128 [Mortierella sp. GBAus27b]
MKSLSVAALVALSVASQAAAQVLYYTSPTSVTTWTAGSTATVSWNNTCSDVSGSTSFPIYLNYQQGGLQVAYPGIDPLGTLDCSSAGSTQVTVPMVPAGNTYSILVTDGSTQSYSSLFTINSTIPATTTSAASTTVASTTSAASTSASAASTTLPSVTKASATATPTTNPNNAATLKAGSTAALVIVAAVASLML